MILQEKSGLIIVGHLRADSQKIATFVMISFVPHLWGTVGVVIFCFQNRFLLVQKSVAVQKSESYSTKRRWQSNALSTPFDVLKVLTADLPTIRAMLDELK